MFIISNNDFSEDKLYFKIKENNIENKIVMSIIEKMKNIKDIVFIEFRDTIYDIFIYNIDVNECIYKIISHFIETKEINEENIEEIIFQGYKFFRYYNNKNYIF